MSHYDKDYQQEDLFGQPYAEFVAFMADWQPKGKALDVGCGQGRDSLFLAAQGYHVTGIDASGVGVRQMLAEAEKQDVLVEGIVADIYAFAFTERYDVIVLDSFLHFARDKAKELKLLATLCQQLQEDGIICLFVHRSKSSERILKDFFTAYPSSWRVLMDDYLDYTYRDKASDFVSSFQYHSYIVQKELP